VKAARALRRLGAVILAVAIMGGAAAVREANAQDPPAADPPPQAPVAGPTGPAPTPPTPDFVLGGPAERSPPSPRGAFLRSLVIPGWGHAAIGSYHRGAFYAAAESGIAYALVRTRLRLSEARDRVELREGVIRRSLAAEEVTDATEVANRLSADPRLADARGLVSARESQQEDWLALGIFLMLLGGADAYVSTHLANFPDPIEVGLLPSASGGVELAVRIPWRGP